MLVTVYVQTPEIRTINRQYRTAQLLRPDQNGLVRDRLIGTTIFEGGEYIVRARVFAILRPLAAENSRQRITASIFQLIGLNLGFDLVNMRLRIVPGINEVLGSQPRIALEKVTFAKTQLTGAIKQPYGNASLADAGYAAHHPFIVFDTVGEDTSITGQFS